MKLAPVFLFLLALPVTLPVGAGQYYRWVDAQGKVHYSDQPAPAGTKQAAEKSFKNGAAEKPATQPQVSVTLYSTATCGQPCEQAKSHLTNRGVAYTSKDPATDVVAGFAPAGRDVQVMANPGPDQKTLPATADGSGRFSVDFSPESGPVVFDIQPWVPNQPQTPESSVGATISDVQIAILITSTVLMFALVMLVRKTRLGRAMRATAQAPQIAGLMGVNVNTIISLTFVIGSGLAAVAGVMVSAYYGLAHYYMGFLLGLKAFSAAVLGGIGNLAGAMLGGLLLGVIESLGAGYIGDLSGGFLGSHYQDVFAFFVLILVLVLRPSGLLGERVVERA